MERDITIKERNSDIKQCGSSTCTLNSLTLLPEWLFFFFLVVLSSLLHRGFLQLQRTGATLHCGAWASHCSGFSCGRAWALSVRASVVAEHAGSAVVACRLQSTGSVVVTNGLSCSPACGIFPDQGSNPCPLHW